MWRTSSSLDLDVATTSENGRNGAATLTPAPGRVKTRYWVPVLRSLGHAHRKRSPRRPARRRRLLLHLRWTHRPAGCHRPVDDELLAWTVRRRLPRRSARPARAPPAYGGRGSAGRRWPSRAVATASTCFLLALNRTSVANTLVVMNTGPYLAALLGWFLLGERVRARTWLAMTITLAGTAVMVSGSRATGTLAGDFLALAWPPRSPPASWRCARTRTSDGAGRRARRAPGVGARPALHRAPVHRSARSRSARPLRRGPVRGGLPTLHRARVPR
jgi:EamA-like transporter family